MSLINDALKKAQRDRDPLSPKDALGAGASGRARARTPAQHWLIVLGSGALVLVVLSVAFTLFWTTPDTPPRKATSIAPSTLPASTAAASAPTPAIVPVLPAARPAPAEAPLAVATTAPVPPAPATPASPTSRPESPAPSSPAQPAATAPGKPAPAAVASATAASSQVESAPLPATQAAAAPARATSLEPAGGAASPPATPPPPPPPLPPPPPDEKVAAFIGTMRVTGVRALSEDSRVLINERVYRVNDVIDRNLGIRLVRVESGSLHFVDRRGVTYVKYL